MQGDVLMIEGEVQRAQEVFQKLEVEKRGEKRGHQRLEGD